MIALTKQKDSGFGGTFVFQFQTAYEKTGAELNFGLFGLGQREIGTTGSIAGKTYKVHCLTARNWAFEQPPSFCKAECNHRSHPIVEAFGGKLVNVTGLCLDDKPLGPKGATPPPTPAPTSPPTPAPTPPPTLNYQTHTDGQIHRCVGEQITMHYGISTVSACEAQCDAHQYCVGFEHNAGAQQCQTYRKVGFAANTDCCSACHIKTSRVSGTAWANYHDGQIHRCTGNQISTFTGVSSQGGCQLKCNSNGDCSGYEYNAGHQHCITYRWVHFNSALDCCSNCHIKTLARL